MNKIKKHWKEILIAVLTLFSLNKCTQSCNRGIHIDELEGVVKYQDSTITSYDSQVKQLQKDTAQYIKELKVYKGFTETMASNIAKQNEIAEQNAKNAADQKKQNAAILKKLNEKNN